MIKAIIFDFGRVVSAPKPEELFFRYENELGLEAGTINTIMFDSPHWHRALFGEIDWTGYWLAVGPALNLSSHEATTAFAVKYYLDERINSDVLEVIRSCFGKYKLAILSNHPPGLSEWLIDWGIDELFDVVFCSGDEGAVKPDPEVYHQILTRLQVPAHEAIFIDDTPGHVDMAVSLGIHGIVLKEDSNLKQDLADLLHERVF